MKVWNVEVTLNEAPLPRRWTVLAETAENALVTALDRARALGDEGYLFRSRVEYLSEVTLVSRTSAARLVGELLP